MSHVDDGTLHAYLDGELSPVEARGVEAHVAQCPGCRGRLEEERALIARADELLGRAAPPDRAVPPFRPGDLEPPVRLWWRVRLPLAWAATVLLALGVGRYLGRERPEQLASQAARNDGDARSQLALREIAPTETAGPAARAPAAAAAATPPAYQPARAKQSLATRPRPTNAPTPTAPMVGALDEATRIAQQAAPRAEAPAAAAAPSGVVMLDGYEALDPLTTDGARALLGTDPRAVPGLPIRGIYRARRIGYSAVVVVEQALDSSRVIRVINAHPSSVALEAIVVSDAARPDTVHAAERAERAQLGRAAAATADSAAVAPLARKAAAQRARSAAGDRPTDLLLEVRGPLSPDSLAALQRRLQPLRP